MIIYINRLILQGGRGRKSKKRNPVQLADGTETVVRLEGQFRVTQNGETVGIINAGKDTLTLNSTDKVRIVPMAETISPEWDLNTATAEVVPEGIFLPMKSEAERKSAFSPPPSMEVNISHPLC